MKKTILTTVVISTMLLSACGGENKTEGGDAVTETVVTETEVKSGLTVQEASDSISTSDTSKGKEVTINAYCWGISETTNGTVRLNLGDEKAEGMVQVTFYAEFPEAKTEELKKIEKNTKVTVKGKLASDAYSKFISNSELLQ